jgi:hypothetical protein
MPVAGPPDTLIRFAQIRAGRARRTMPAFNSGSSGRKQNVEINGTTIVTVGRSKTTS